MIDVENNCHPRELHGKKMVGYILGSLGQLLPQAVFLGYAFQYYVYTIGLDAFVASVGVFLGLFVSAVGWPIFGVISDNLKPNRFGKRRRLMLMGLPIFLIASILIWTPPLCPKGEPLYLPTAFYFIILSCIANAGYTIEWVAYGAMLPEQCQTESNRLKVSSINGISSIVGAILGILLPIILQSNLKDPKNAFWWEPDGQYLVDLMPWVGTFLAIVGTGLIILSVKSVDESFHLTIPPLPHKNIKDTFVQMAKPLHDLKFRNYMYQNICGSIGGRIILVVMLPVMTFVLELLGFQFVLFIILIIPFTFMGFIIWNIIGKKKGVYKGYQITYIGMIVPMFVALIFLVPFSVEVKFWIGVFLVGFALACFMGAFIYPAPLTSALIDIAAIKINPQNKTEAVSNIAGTYLGVNNLLFNMASAFANVVLGVILSGENAVNPIVIMATLPVAGVFYIIGLFFLIRVKLTEPDK